VALTAPTAPTGRRLRERRIVLGIKQADLARSVGISPAYLNLIEHNRRRIGGKLLLELARALEIDPSALSESAETEAVAALREAASQARPGDPPPEAARAGELAARFPGWAALIAARNTRVADLERTVAALTDRLTHDPFLSATLHEILSTVTAIRSTAGILAGEAVDPEWQARFHRNLYDEARRLAEGAQSLAAYLDAGAEEENARTAPQDEVEVWLSEAGFHVPALEGAPEDIEAEAARLIDAASGLDSAPARQIARAWLTRYARDAARMPLAEVEAALEELGADPAALAERFGVSPAAAMRRLGALPPGPRGPRFGVVICDGSGTLTFREPVEGFALPRFGAACPLWPLYTALSRPGLPVREEVEMPGPPPMRFRVHAICRARGRPRFDMPPILEATMLIEPIEGEGEGGGAALPVGTSCRICPRAACPARREPSILAEGL